MIITDQSAEAFRVRGGRCDGGLVIVCDHARNAFPEGYGTLGVAPDQLKRHIAYDIGAEAITLQVAEALGVPAVLSNYSRLLIDPNRGADDPTLIMRLSDGAIIPGNRHLDEQERAKRITLYYEPYHQAIDTIIDRCLAAGIAPAILSLHSFTESWKSAPRPWHVGILWDKDPRLAQPLLDAFYAEGDLIVGDNQPYVGHLKGDCLYRHATERGLASAIIEYRQDLVRDEAGQRQWAERTVRIMRAIMQHEHTGPRLRVIETHGSKTDTPRDQARRLAALHRQQESTS